MIPVTANAVGSTSFIHALGYNAETRTATVEFKRRGGYAIYQYRGVKSVTFARWLKAQSKGAYFHRNIRNRFACKRIA